MAFKFPDYDDEALPDLKFSFRSKDAKRPLELHRTPLYGYDYLDIDSTEFCFSQECLDAKDILSYFKKVKEMSKKSINDLIDSNYKEHFHILTNPNKRIKDLVKKISGKAGIRDEELPAIGQFGLYTENARADKTTGVKSPRIFFFVGANAVIYILFYDPFHQIYSGRIQ